MKCNLFSAGALCNWLGYACSINFKETPSNYHKMCGLHINNRDKKCPEITKFRIWFHNKNYHYYPLTFSVLYTGIYKKTMQLFVEKNKLHPKTCRRQVHGISSSATGDINPRWWLLDSVAQMVVGVHRFRKLFRITLPITMKRVGYPQNRVLLLLVSTFDFSIDRSLVPSSLLT